MSFNLRAQSGGNLIFIPTHLPQMDFSDKTMTHESWLKAFMDEGIDCVAITDHNSGDWIDDFKTSFEGSEE